LDYGDRRAPLAGCPRRPRRDGTLIASVAATGSIAHASTVGSGHRDRRERADERVGRCHSVSDDSVAARQAAIEVVEQLDEPATSVDNCEDGDRHREGGAPAGGDETDRHERHRRGGGPQPHAQPRGQQRRRLVRLARDLTRQVQLNPEVARDGDNPSERRAEREDAERLR
jgi:hypothetical protein